MRIISGKYGRRRFDVPNNITARPTTDFARENLFNVLENLVDFNGARALDLFAGTGAVSFEFLSRGCSSVTAVEKAAVQCSFIKKVSAILGCAGFTLLRCDALRYVKTCHEQYDIIFADPPYDMAGFGEIPQMVIDSAMLKPGTIFIMEHSEAYDFSALPHIIDHRAYGSVNFSIFSGF